MYICKCVTVHFFWRLEDGLQESFFSYYANPRVELRSSGLTAFRQWAIFLTPKKSWFVFLKRFIFMCMGTFFSFCLHVDVCTLYMYSALKRSAESIRSPWVTDGYEQPCECWQSNLGLLQEWQMLVTTPAPKKTVLQYTENGKDFKEIQINIPLAIIMFTFSPCWLVFLSLFLWDKVSLCSFCWPM